MQLPEHPTESRIHRADETRERKIFTKTGDSTWMKPCPDETRVPGNTPNPIVAARGRRGDKINYPPLAARNAKRSGWSTPAREKKMPKHRHAKCASRSSLTK